MPEQVFPNFSGLEDSFIDDIKAQLGQNASLLTRNNLSFSDVQDALRSLQKLLRQEDCGPPPPATRGRATRRGRHSKQAVCDGTVVAHA